MAGIFVQYHAQAVQAFAKVSVLQVIGEENQKGESLEFVYSEEEGLQVMRVYYRKHAGALGTLFDAWLYLSGSLKGYTRLIAKAGKADVHHVHVLTRAGFLPWLLHLFGGQPYLITEHWSRYLPQNRKYFKGSLRKWLTKKVVNGAYAVCPVNDNLGKAMQEMGFDNQRYLSVPNVVDLSRFKPASKEAPRNHFLHVSCFDERAKNTKGLLRALKTALKKRPDLYLHLVGDGVDYEAVKTYAHELALTPFTHFYGLQVGADLVSRFQESACLLMFSNYENQPVVILEAFACGVPVLATRVGGIAEMLANSRGESVEAGDEDGMAELMVTFANNQLNFDTFSLRKYVQEWHSYDAVGRQYAELYKQALKY